ncbi:MAG: PSD1 and planctomycete cytochrome C domain-containing protein [Pirellulaceae bacterium]|nr:PSD1 and planctomycete cytochrome C domain-containing protein [Pirellulaceae bacterium]
MKRIAFYCSLLLFLFSNRALAQQTLDFNRDIRPLLSENCFFCHGQDGNQREADLRLDQARSALDSGAIVPGDSEASSLIERIDSDDPDFIMPPPEANRQLSPEQKKRLRQWIDEGGKYEKHWAFSAPQRPTPPSTKLNDWAKNPIDQFVLSKLESRGLSPSPQADRSTLIKRLSIDLLGLPPTIEEVDAFVSDPDPAAYEKLVDRMLANPHYGERLALPWLDAARYSDSNGFQQDGDTWQWIWRDWVVRAINDDLPFDQFTIWQVAGDLLPDATPDQKIASGFNRNHMLNGEGGAIAEEQRFVNLFDRVDTTSTTWLGLTMACAQCHDHKYDPVTQKDYYQFLDAFNRVPESGTPQRQSSRIRVGKPFLELPTAENKKHIAALEKKISDLQSACDSATDLAYTAWKLGINSDGDASDLTGLPAGLVAILKIEDAARSDGQKTSLETGLRKHFESTALKQFAKKVPAMVERNKIKQQLSNYRGDQIPRVMIMSDDKPRKSHILARGEYLKPGKEVSFNTPAFLPPLPKGAPKNRLGLAQWLVAPENPLVARVQMNRVWQYFLGASIVNSPENLGVQSEFPIHRDLLDWLAVEFRTGGWSMKRMNRLILTSATYQQSSRVTPDHLTKDPGNQFYGRASRFRMPSMILRDWALASSDLLVQRVGGPPVYPYQPDNVWEPLAITKERDFTYPASAGEDLYRRSLYTFWRRTVGPANMFDASNRQACRVRNSETSTPLHALTTLNDPTWVEAARCLAASSLQHAKSLEPQLVYAFRKVLCRTPTTKDLQRLSRAHQKQLEIYQSDETAALALLSIGQAKRNTELQAPQHAAMTAVCLALLNLDEALTRE